ncbi:MAG: EAL domain-containing protein [Actinomycetia bacterium]|nr:EAL domain-containing protein [Actinomycetes bacterium]
MYDHPSPGKPWKIPSRMRVLTCVFQPIVNLADGTVVGYEALGRLQGKEQDGYAPVQAWAAENGVPMVRVRRHLLLLALDRGRLRPPGTQLFVNLDRSLAEEMVAWTARGVLTLDGVVLEVAETEADDAVWSDLVARLRAAGATIALDDYGAGVDDLTRLVHLRPEYVKLAGAVSRHLGSDPYADRIVESLAHQAQFSGFKLIVEQVEDPQVLARLPQLGVRYAQGFCLGRPDRGFAESVTLPRTGSGRPTVMYPHVPMAGALHLGLDDLSLLREAQDLVASAVDEAIEDLPQWVASTPAGATITRFSDFDTHIRQVRSHLRRLLQGHLDATAIEAAAQSASRHIGLDVELGWYVVAHLRLAARIREILTRAGRPDLAGPVSKLAVLDLATFADAYAVQLNRDEITGLLGRRAFFARATEHLRQAAVTAGTWAFVLISIEGLEAFAAARGYRAVDEALRHAGRLFASLVRPDRLVGRVGGSLFAILLPYREVSLMDELVAHLQTVLAAGHPRLRIRWGMSTTERDGRTVDDLFAGADADLTAKRKDRRNATTHP